MHWKLLGKYQWRRTVAGWDNAIGRLVIICSSGCALFLSLNFYEVYIDMEELKTLSV